MNFTGKLQLILLLMLILPVTATAQSLKNNARLFNYDRSRSFDLKTTNTQNENRIQVRDLNYAGYDSKHERIKGYLVSPRQNGRFAGILFFHWLGKPKGDRSEFLDEAIALARQGVVSLLIQGYFPWSEAPTNGPADRQEVIDQTIEVRRALDLLVSQPNVDHNRIAFVGHDYGAMYGSIISAFEKRVKAYVLIAGMGNFGDWSLKYWPATATAGEQTYRQAMADVDPINFIAQAKPSALLFQFANADIYISHATAQAFFDKASEPKLVKWYDAEHDLNIETARTDREDWLAKRLGLSGSN